MSGRMPTKYSAVDNKYGINRLAKLGLDSNVFPDTSCEGMNKLMQFLPIDFIGEYYGIMPDSKNNVNNYINKSIENPEHIQIVEQHFESIGMPIPQGLKGYEAYMNSTKEVPQKQERKKEGEVYIKPMKSEFEMTSDQKQIFTNNVGINDGQHTTGETYGKISGSTDQGTNEPSRTSISDGEPKKKVRKFGNINTNHDKKGVQGNEIHKDESIPSTARDPEDVFKGASKVIG